MRAKRRQRSGEAWLPGFARSARLRAMPEPEPFCLLVSGPPGAGKTTFAYSLGERLSLPVISMDQVKSSIAMGMTSRDTTGTPALQDASVAALGGPAGQRAFEVTYRVAETFLRGGVSIIIEKAWQRGRGEADLQQLITLANAAQLHVTSSQAVAVSRGLARPARAGLVNMDAVAAMLDSGEMRWESFAPLDLPVPLLVINTDGAPVVDWAEVERFVWASTIPA